jgi:hypothetical protein
VVMAMTPMSSLNGFTTQTTAYLHRCRIGVGAGRCNGRHAGSDEEQKLSKMHFGVIRRKKKKETSSRRCTSE